MWKLNIFEDKMEKEDKNYVLINYSTIPTAMVEFTILPTDNTKKLFTELWKKLDKNTNTSILNFKETIMKIDNLRSELNIISSMSFSLYSLNTTEGHNEIFGRYPIIIEIIKTPVEIKIKFQAEFKSYFDKFLEL